MKSKHFHQNITGNKYIKPAAFNFGCLDRRWMNKTWRMSEVTWLRTKWEVWNFQAKHLFITGSVNTKYCLKEGSEQL